MRSLAHPAWPYVGTPYEWRGFAVKATQERVELEADLKRANPLSCAEYQKLNFGRLD